MRLGALHPCPHATVTWSPWVGGTRQYMSDIVYIKCHILEATHTAKSILRNDI